MKVRDIPDNLTPITDSQEIESTLEYIGYDGNYDDYGCLFVEILDGDYGDIFGLESNIPYLHYDVDKLR